MVPATTEAAGEAELDGANVYLLYQVRARLHLTGRITAFRSRAARDPEARLEPVEPAANGPAVIQRPAWEAETQPVPEI